MQLNVTGHHVEVTESMRGYVEKKLERIGRHYDQVLDVHCILTVEKLRQKAEATLHVSGTAIHTQATDENMYAAIDLLTDKLDRCLKKHKAERIGSARRSSTHRLCTFRMGAHGRLHRLIALLRVHVTPGRNVRDI